MSSRQSFLFVSKSRSPLTPLKKGGTRVFVFRPPLLTLIRGDKSISLSSPPCYLNKGGQEYFSFVPPCYLNKGRTRVFLFRPPLLTLIRGGQEYFSFVPLLKGDLGGSRLRIKATFIMGFSLNLSPMPYAQFPIPNSQFPIISVLPLTRVTLNFHTPTLHNSTAADTHKLQK